MLLGTLFAFEVGTILCGHECSALFWEVVKLGCKFSMLSLATLTYQNGKKTLSLRETDFCCVRALTMRRDVCF